MDVLNVAVVAVLDVFKFVIVVKNVDAKNVIVVVGKMKMMTRIVASNLVIVSNVYVNVVQFFIVVDVSDVKNVIVVVGIYM